MVALVGKNLLASTGDVRGPGSIPGSGRAPGGGHGNPLQYSCLENPMGRGAWWAAAHKVAKSWAQPKHTHTCAVVVIIALATMTNTENKNVPGWKER